MPILSTFGSVSSRGFGKNLSSGFAFAQTITSNTPNYNLRSAAIAAGWDGTTPLNAAITINSGVYVYSNSTGSYSFDTGTSFPAGSTLSLINDGIILGRGGNGGAGENASNGVGTAGSPGGPAFRAQHAITITNNNIIAGGGGGGGGGGNQTDGDSESVAGGGGGGGRGISSGGAAGVWGGFSTPQAGGAGTLASAGAGGIGESEDATGGTGGNGGGFGATGGTGGFGGRAGGAGGACTSGNSLITWLVTGSRYGTLG